MTGYKKILLAVELEGASDELLVAKAVHLRDEFNADLYLVHAIENLSSYGAAYGVVAGADIEEMLLTNAREAMLKVGKTANVSEDKQIIRVGSGKNIILEEATTLGIDLIIVGSHGRHGIRLLLGSTANAVLHGSEVDVLAVRLKDNG